MSTLQCVIKSRGGEEDVKKTAEIAGKGKDYLSSLSASLSAMQAEVNSFLTQLVEKEKAEKEGGTPVVCGTTSGDEDMEEEDDEDNSSKEPVTKKPKT